MGLTNFPNGISSFGIPIYGSEGISGGPLTGTVLFVDTVNGVDAGSGASPNSPYQTLSYALTQAVAGNTTIYILPGSTTTISSATSLLLNVAGVTIYGLGTGNMRPLFNFTTANTATIPVSAANVSIINCRFSANFLSIAAPITLTAGGFLFEGNHVFDSSGVLNFLNVINASGAANTANFITAQYNTWKGLGTTSVNTFVLTANDIDRLVFIGNQINLATTVDQASAVVVTAGVLTQANIGYNRVYRNNTTTANSSLVNVGGTTSNGFVYNNYVQTLTTTSDKLFTTTVGLSAFNNFVTGVKGASGFLIPTADS